MPESRGASSLRLITTRTTRRPDRARSAICSTETASGRFRSASRRAKSRIAGSEPTSAITISAAAKARAARRVKRSAGPSPDRTCTRPIGSEPSAIACTKNRRASSISPAWAARAAGPDKASRRNARRACSWGNRVRICSWNWRIRAATRPTPSGIRCSISLRKRPASIGEEPPVPTAATTSPRSMMAGVVKSHRAGRSVTFTKTPAVRAAAAAAAANPSSGSAIKVRSRGRSAPTIGPRVLAVSRCSRASRRTTAVSPRPPRPFRRPPSCGRPVGNRRERRPPALGPTLMSSDR